MKKKTFSYWNRSRDSTEEELQFLKTMLICCSFSYFFSWTFFELRIINDAICTKQDLSIVTRRRRVDFYRQDNF